MDLPVGPTVGALRLGIQIASTAKRPLIEIYQRTHNVLGIEQEFPDPGSPGGVAKHRFSESYISFTAVNIGTRRAENVVVEIGDGLQRNDHPFGELFGATIPVIAPGQSLSLLRLQETDLFEYEWEEQPSGLKTGRPRELKVTRLKIDIGYDGPRQGLGRFTRMWSSWLGKKQFQLRYEFEPRSVATDYPPLEVLG